MIKAPDFSSRFSPDFKEYVAFMVGSGRVFRVESSILKAFDRYIQENSIIQITEEVVKKYVYSVNNLSTQQYAKRHRVIQKFSEYLYLRERGECIRPLPTVRNSKRHIAYVYSDVEIAKLIFLSEKLPPSESLRSATYSVLFGLLYSTGMRISEAISLDICDVDFNNEVIFIRNTKFRKSRIVPVHWSTIEKMKKYFETRNSLYPECSEKAFFLNNRKKRLCYSTVNATFLELSRQLGLRNTNGQMPRIHDLRHTFAIRRVANWYDEGVDINSKLPLLATYMGHSHFEDTTYYLMAGAEIMARGASRFQREGETNG